MSVGMHVTNIVSYQAVRFFLRLQQRINGQITENARKLSVGVTAAHAPAKPDHTAFGGGSHMFLAVTNSLPMYLNLLSRIKRAPGFEFSHSPPNSVANTNQSDI
jgi:hypothetical protein